MRKLLSFLIAGFLICGVAFVVAGDLNAIEIKVYNGNTVYLDKIIPKDQTFHTVLHVDTDSTHYIIDLTYDPSAGNSISEVCHDNFCNLTVRAGPNAHDFLGDVNIEFIPTHADFGTKAPVPLGSIGAMALLLAALLLRRGRP
ncbi:hypothetical protein [Thermococcus sp. AM4]|uniref:hypothetical protein n=1 Tax=Thermococcus sp. (strain AM4) TaxID=246969 RepID=UPI000186FA3B|nr:hypothetical protein [Thermococcus sp. AM4]EEB75056.1 hypothetical protein TAM4_1001 [Thermococcus sp. AM4]